MNDVKNVTDARKECSDDPKCAMFVDNGGSGTKFYSCAPDANVYRSRTSKSIIYFKGNFLHKYKIYLIIYLKNPIWKNSSIHTFKT